MLNFLFFSEFKPMSFPSHPIQKYQYKFWLFEKKLSLNQCCSMWTTEIYPFSLINWHWHFIYCMWFQYCFPLSFFQIKVAKSATLTQLLSHLWVEIYSFWSWEKERRSQDVTGRSHPCKNCSESQYKTRAAPHVNSGSYFGPSLLLEKFLVKGE